MILILKGIIFKWLFWHIFIRIFMLLLDLFWDLRELHARLTECFLFVNMTGQILYRFKKRFRLYFLCKRIRAIRGSIIGEIHELIYATADSAGVNLISLSIGWRRDEFIAFLGRNDVLYDCLRYFFVILFKIRWRFFDEDHVDSVGTFLINEHIRVNKFKAVSELLNFKVEKCRKISQSLIFFNILIAVGCFLIKDQKRAHDVGESQIYNWIDFYGLIEGHLTARHYCHKLMDESLKLRVGEWLAFLRVRENEIELRMLDELNYVAYQLSGIFFL